MNEELNNVVSEQPIKNNSNKKIFIIIGIVVAVLAVVGVFLGKSLLGNKEDEVVDKFAVSEITGEVELAMKSTDKISRFVEYNKGYRNLEHFFGTDKDGNFAVYDANGNILMPVKGAKLYKETNMYFRYLGDGYFIYNTLEGEYGIGTVIVKNGEIVADLRDYGFIYISYCHYKDGILYAAFGNQDYSFAYDIEAKKELWRLDDSAFVSNYALDEDFIRLQTKVNPTKDDIVFGDTLPNTILDFGGNKIVSGADLSPKEGFTSSYDSRILTTTQDAYYELKDDEYIKVFDLKGNLKTTISLKETDTVRYYLARVLKSGLFMIMEADKATSKTVDVIYNTDGKEILRGDISFRSFDYGSSVTYYNLPIDYELFDFRDESGSSCVIVKDGEVAGKYSRCMNASTTYNGTNDYIMVFDKDSENPVTYSGETFRILNIHTMKTITAPIKYTSYTNIVNIGLNGKYVILKEDKNGKYYVYDENLNKKYESEDNLIPINDKFVLKTNYSVGTSDTEFDYTLVNVETGEENEIDVKGKYQTSNSRGLVTYDGEYYYLYTFK